MPQIRMKVGGMEYAINSDDDEAYVKGIGAKLDARLDALAKKNPFLSTTMVAVLAALEAYDESSKAQSEIEALRLEIKQLLEENAMSKMTAAMANRRLEEVLTERNDTVCEKHIPPVTEEEEKEYYLGCDDEDEDDQEAALFLSDEEDEQDDDMIFAESESGQYEIF